LGNSATRKGTMGKRNVTYDEDGMKKCWFAELYIYTSLGY
jgi:hypothetical protein